MHSMQLFILLLQLFSLSTLGVSRAVPANVPTILNPQAKYEFFAFTQLLDS